MTNFGEFLAINNSKHGEILQPFYSTSQTLFFENLIIKKCIIKQVPVTHILFADVRLYSRESLIMHKY